MKRPPAMTQKLGTKTQSTLLAYTSDGSVRKPPRSALVGAIARPRAPGFESADMRITISIANAYRFLTMCLRFVGLDLPSFMLGSLNFNMSRFCFLLLCNIIFCNLSCGYLCYYQEVRSSFSRDVFLKFFFKIFSLKFR